MLSSQQILDKIQVWENQTTEFKREFTTDGVRKALVAFSNDYHELGGGLPNDKLPGELERELSRVLSEAGLPFTSVAVKINGKRKKRFAIIKTSDDVAAQKIIKWARTTVFLDRQLSAHPHIS